MKKLNLKKEVEKGHAPKKKIYKERGPQSKNKDNKQNQGVTILKDLQGTSWNETIKRIKNVQTKKQQIRMVTESSFKKNQALKLVQISRTSRTSRNNQEANSNDRFESPGNNVAIATEKTSLTFLLLILTMMV